MSAKIFPEASSTRVDDVFFVDDEKIIETEDVVESVTLFKKKHLRGNILRVAVPQSFAGLRV